MNVLIYSLLSFCSAFLIHLLVWRVRPPKKNNTIVLMEIFFAVSILSIAAIKAFGTIYGYLSFLLLYYSLVLCYIVSYSAIEVDSPSLKMVLEIAKEKSGLEQGEFYSRMTDEVLVIPRIDDLIRDRMVLREGERLRLSSKGALLADAFILWRRLLKAGKGG